MIALGFTVAAAVMFAGGALGAWARAVISGTQKTWPVSERLIVDLLMGGCGGILMPISAPLLNRTMGIAFETWTTAQQAALAIMLGGSGSYVWTAIAWRRGLIVTESQAARREAPTANPEMGVLNPQNAKRPSAPWPAADKEEHAC